MSHPSNAEALERLAAWPDDMLSYRAIAEVTGVSFKSIQRSRFRGESPLPSPDERVGDPVRGVALWKRETVRTWLESRRGRGKAPKSEAVSSA